jgi:hypothetical protein
VFVSDSRSAGRRRGETLRLTLNEETNVDHPYAHRNHYNDPIFVPDGDTSAGRKQL